MNRYRFLLGLIVEHKYSYLAGALTVIATLWMTLTIPAYLEQAVEILRSQPDNRQDFLGYIYWILGFALAIIVTRTASRMLFFTPGRRVEYDLKNRLLSHLATLQRDFFLDNPTGAIISRLNNDINGVRMLMGFGLLQLINSIATLSLAPYRMYQISPFLTGAVALPIVLGFAGLQIAVRRLRKLQQAQMKSMQDISDFTVETYNGLDVLRSYRALDWAEGRFEGFNASIRDQAVRMANIRALFMPILTHVVNALKVFLVLYGGMMVIRAELTVGEFMAFALYLSLLLPPLMGMTFLVFVLQRGFTALSSLEVIFNTRPGLPPPDPWASQALPERLREGLRVKNLHFAFPDAPDTRVLQDIDFSLAPGEIVGVFGAIGSGKTTLVNCLNRYLPTPPGCVSLDGVDITRLELAKLRHHVVSVTQEAFLFADTIRENVRFASDADDEQVQEALRAAAMAGEVSRFPAGLDTIAGEKGINLSGGQKQRISLARALLTPCDILILDDVMSAVDQETERYLIDSIYGFRQARSLLIVSHRISVLERADRILVLEHGRMSALGTHAELVRRPGVYRDAQRMQQEEALHG